MTATAHNVTPSSYGISGWDVDVEITLEDGTVLDGEVSLVPDRANDGAPAAYGGPGSASTWVSSGLLERLEALEDSMFRAALLEIEAAAAAAIERSGIAPAIFRSSPDRDDE